MESCNVEQTAFAVELSNSADSRDLVGILLVSLEDVAILHQYDVIPIALACLDALYLVVDTVVVACHNLLPLFRCAAPF